MGERFLVLTIFEFPVIARKTIKNNYNLIIINGGGLQPWVTHYKRTVTLAKSRKDKWEMAK